MEPSTASNQPLIEGSSLDIYEGRSFRRQNCYFSTFVLNDRQAAIAATVYTIASFFRFFYLQICSSLIKQQTLLYNIFCNALCRFLQSTPLFIHQRKNTKAYDPIQSRLATVQPYRITNSASSSSITVRQFQPLLVLYYIQDFNRHLS